MIANATTTNATTTNAATATTATATAPEKTVPSTCEIIIDTREQKPYEFKTLRANADQGHARIIVPTLRLALTVGDYSVRGMAELVTVERKSKEDLYSSIGQRRDNFAQRMKTMGAMAMSAVVVEADWASLLLDPPKHSKLHPRSLSRTILSWMIRHPRVHWLMLPDRATAEVMTYRFLERFHTFWLEGRTFDQELFKENHAATLEPNRWIAPWEKQATGEPITEANNEQS
jgi:hypothetical protein